MPATILFLVMCFIAALPIVLSMWALAGLATALASIYVLPAAIFQHFCFGLAWFGDDGAFDTAVWSVGAWLICSALYYGVYWLVLEDVSGDNVTSAPVAQSAPAWQPQWQPQWQPGDPPQLVIEIPVGPPLHDRVESACRTAKAVGIGFAAGLYAQRTHR